MPKVYGFASEQDRDLFHGDVGKLASAHSASVKLAKVGDKGGLLEVGDNLKDSFVERLVAQKYASYVEKVALLGAARKLFGGVKDVLHKNWTPKALRPDNNAMMREVDYYTSKVNPTRLAQPFLPRQVTGGTWGGYDKPLAPTLAGSHSAASLRRFRGEAGDAPFASAKTPEELSSSLKTELNTANPRHGNTPAQYAADFDASLSPWYKLKAMVPHVFSAPQDAMMYARTQALKSGNKELAAQLDKRLSSINVGKWVGRAGIVGGAAAVPAYQRGRQERNRGAGGMMTSYANTLGNAVGNIAPNAGAMIRENPQLAALLTGGAGLSLLYMLLSNRGQR